VTTTVQSAVCGVGESLFDHLIVTLYVFGAVLLATFRVAFAVPPTPAADVKPVRLIPVTGVLTMLALVTVPSGSDALTPTEVAVP
jgi:hypothetical protein